MTTREPLTEREQRALEQMQGNRVVLATWAAANQ
jgi:hypothetical protein